MRATLLLAAFLLSGCVSAWQWNGPGSRNGFAHGIATAALTVGSEKVTGNAKYGALAGCVWFVSHEFEESRGFSDWHVGGKTDGILDMVVPCVVGFSFALHLR